MSKRLTDKHYIDFFNTIKNRIQGARIAAIRSVNKELIKLYWDIGEMIIEKQKECSWGKSVVEKLAGDLQKEFDNTAGYSAQNLWYTQRAHKI